MRGILARRRRLIRAAAIVSTPEPKASTLWPGREENNVMAHIFDPKRLHEIASGAVGLPLHEIHPNLSEELSKAYPGHIHSEENWSGVAPV